VIYWVGVSEASSIAETCSMHEDMEEGGVRRM